MSFSKFLKLKTAITPSRNSIATITSPITPIMSSASKTYDYRPKKNPYKKPCMAESTRNNIIGPELSVLLPIVPVSF